VSIPIRLQGVSIFLGGRGSANWSKTDRRDQTRQGGPHYAWTSLRDTLAVMSRVIVRLRSSELTVCRFEVHSKRPRSAQGFKARSSYSRRRSAALDPKEAS
jgi:hypothetical protein